MITAQLAVPAWTAAGLLASLMMWPLTRRHEHIPHWHAIVQVGVTTGLFAALAWRWTTPPDLLLPSTLAVTAIPLAIIDARTNRLPNWLLLPTNGTVVAAAIIAAVAEHAPGQFLRALTGAALFLVFHGALYAVFPGQLGGGDVKLAGPLGAVLAWSSWTNIFVGLLLGWILAFLAHLIIRIFQQNRLQAIELPLGPFLIIGTFTTVLVLHS
jgi:leader peptidase (prepilin peptidase) / N-methyltransferase